jgi:hypothetical protein
VQARNDRKTLSHSPESVKQLWVRARNPRQRPGAHAHKPRNHRVRHAPSLPPALHPEWCWCSSFPVFKRYPRQPLQVAHK